MPDTLPAPEVVRCYFDDGFEPPLSAMALRWEPGVADEECLWELPEDVTITGPPPRRFGITIRRRAADTYAVRLLWGCTGFRWQALTRGQLLTSSLQPLLDVLGTNLWYLLEQPVDDEAALPARAA
jgi:hypothetical protein